MKLTIGKIRGLAATSSGDGAFTILAFDHRQSFVRMLTPRQGETIPYADIVAAKAAVVTALSPHASAVLLDPEYSAAQSIAGGFFPQGLKTRQVWPGLIHIPVSANPSTK